MKITDLLGDLLEVEIYYSGVHGEVVSVCSKKTGKLGHPAWLTYEQAKDLEWELARLRLAHEEEVAKKAAAETEISYRVMYNPMGFAQAVNPEPELRTFHITINGDDVTIWKE